MIIFRISAGINTGRKVQNNKWINATNKLRLKNKQKPKKKNQISSNKSNEILKQPMIVIMGGEEGGKGKPTVYRQNIM